MSFSEGPAAAMPPLPSGPDEARAFWRMRGRTFATQIKTLLREGRLRVATILFLSLLLWVGLFWLFHDGFTFLDTAIPTPDLYDRTVQAIFGTFFVALMVMLVFSSGVILYSTLFRARDIPFLLALPARPERVFLTKYQAAIVMSSWAFILLSSPMLLAYGLVHSAPWYFYAMLLPLLIAFTYVPAALGAIACLLIVYRLPSGRSYLLVGAAAATIALAVFAAWSIFSVPESNLLTTAWFQNMLNRLQITEHRLLPSWWLSSGLLESARGQAREAVLFLTLMVSNALFFRQVAIWLAAAVYRTAYSRLHTRKTARKLPRAAWIDRLTLALARGLPRQMRLLIVKDLRLFRRDPVQWSQFLIFAGLLALYFVNIRRFSYDVYYVGWVNAVSFLNVSVVGLLLSTFTTRFVFPMISLEGRRFWFLGLLPLRRETILWSKLAFAVGCTLIPSSLLVLLSDAMLGVAPLVLASHQLTCVLLSLGLSAISVGLGAKMPDLKEESPSRIAAGFGGTLTLVLSTLYIVAIVLLTAVPCHFYYGTEAYVGESTRFSQYIRWWFALGSAASVALAAVVVAVPMLLGIRAFRRLEFTS